MTTKKLEENALLWFNANCRREDKRYAWLLGRNKAHFRQEMSRTWENQHHVIHATCISVLCVISPYQNPHPTSHNALEPLY